MKNLNSSVLRNLFSKFLFLSFSFILFFTNLSAQNPVLNDVNLQLRQYFANLSKPAPAKKFLFEMSAHSTDSTLFVTNSPDTN